MSPRPKIALVHHNLLQNKGGGDFVAAWLLDALHQSFDLSYLTWGQTIDWNALNSYYGTRIDPSRVTTYYCPSLTLLKAHQRPFRLILALYERFVKQLAPRFDLLISTYNEFDFGVPGIQYIHGPSRSTLGAQLYLSQYKESGWRKLYYRLCDQISHFQPDHILQNTTLVNSIWGKDVFQRTYPGTDAEVVYPPVVLPGNNPAPWEQRHTGFLCVGDLLPEKKVDQAVLLIRQLREKGFSVDLHLIGDGKSPYAERVKRMANPAQGIFWEGRLNRAGITSLMNRFQYGIHMRDFEGFGIAIAEMISGGMIPFAHEGGGQAEVLGNDSRILWKDPDDALQKIIRLLQDKALQIAVQTTLLERSREFTLEKFQEKIHQIVERTLTKQSPGPGDCVAIRHPRRSLAGDPRIANDNDGFPARDCGE
ncbi:MAG: glycosyltransferase [Elusimicrobiota bacterium]